MTTELSAWPLLALVGNHLWQSTLFAGLTACLVRLCRRNRPHVRYWLWLAASVKFLIPFVFLVAVGQRFGWMSSAPMVQPEITLAIEAMSEPFSQSALRIAAVSARSSIIAAILSFALVGVWLCGSTFILLTWWARWRRAAAAVRDALPVEHGPELDSLRSLEHTCGIRRPIALVSSDTPLEPGVFGIARPVLFWPRTTGARLDDRQVEAILTHEMIHIRRRDNLAAAMHMTVEAAFWFHPLVWWVGGRLVDERERACDADVVRLGADPQAYAEAILKTCQLCVESPLVCVAGVTGSDLKKRIEAIMSKDAGAALNGWKRLLLATAGAIAIAGPLSVGLLNAPPLRAQSPATEISTTPFASASVKANTSADPRPYPMTIGPNGRFAVTNTPVRTLITMVYRSFPISGGPSWLGTDRFDIQAQAEGNPSQQQMYAMVRRLLADRFNLVVHVEAKMVPVYVLVLANADGTPGPQTQRSSCRGKDTVVFPPGPLDPKLAPPLPCGGIRITTAKLEARWQTMEELAQGLSLMTGRKVFDRTGLSGKFDVRAEWTPATALLAEAFLLKPAPPGPTAPGVGPATFTAIEEQLGLRLESETGPVEMLVIDNIDRPIDDR